MDSFAEIFKNRTQQNQDLNLDTVHKQIRKLLHKTNSLLNRAFNDEVIYDGKKKIDLPFFATETDLEASKIIKESLQARFPQIGFISEEEQLQSSPEDEDLLSEYNWIIDPIDGSQNFANKIPLFATSIALWRGNEPVYAAVSLPMQGDIVHAIKGKGAFLNEQKIDITKQKLAKPYAVYAHISETHKEKLALYDYLLDSDPFPRFLGSGVYQTTMVCLRRIDYAVFIKTAIWDIAATSLIAKEAGLEAIYLSSEPDINNRKAITEFCHSIVIGEKKTAQEIATHIKETLKLS